jgi:hypothetical protein
MQNNLQPDEVLTTGYQRNFNPMVETMLRHVVRKTYPIGRSVRTPF